MGLAKEEEEEKERNIGNYKNVNEGNELIRRPWPPPLDSVHSKKLILHECCNYVVLNKPCDFYMDGIHCQTVHKLLTCWYPSPSLLVAMNEDAARKRKVEDIISTLHQWNAVADNSLRPCHQIDYATSGCLLIARSRMAAAFASKAFEDRRVKKTYLAVVLGHINLNSTDSDTATSCVGNFHDEWCTTTQSPDYVTEQDFHRLWGESALVSKQSNNSNVNNTGGKEYQYRKQKRKEAKKGLRVSGFLPVSAVFCKWQSAVSKYYNMKDKKQQHDTLLYTSRCKEDAYCNGDDDNDDIVAVTEQDPAVITIQGGGGCQIPVPRFANELERMLSDSTTVKWKDIKRQANMEEIVQRFEELYLQYNTSLEHNAPPKMRKERKKWNHVQEYNKAKLFSAETKIDDTSINHDLPTVFQIINEEDNDAFYVNASIAEMKPHFRMIIHPDAMKKHEDLHYRQYYTTTTYSLTENCIEKLDFKPALTKCTVLWRGFLRNSDNSSSLIPVTKVLLQPHTGRRHQLRLHMVALGHPILGDFTYKYSPPHHANMDAKAEKISGRSFTERMCLHAYKLTLPLLVNNNSSKGNETINSSFIANDPFHIVIDEKDGTETLLIDDPKQW